MYTIALHWGVSDGPNTTVTYDRVLDFDQRLLQQPYGRVWARYQEDRTRYPVYALETIDTMLHAQYLRNNTVTPWYTLTFIQEQHINRGLELHVQRVKSIICFYAGYPCQLLTEQKDTHILHL